MVERYVGGWGGGGTLSERVMCMWGGGWGGRVAL